MRRYNVLVFAVKYLVFRIKALWHPSLHEDRISTFYRNVLRAPYHGNGVKFEMLRQKLKTNRNFIITRDFGRGGALVSRSASSIARSSLKSPKLAQLISRICSYYEVVDAIELGTSLGITSCYIADSIHGTLYTYEGSDELADLAEQIWMESGRNNIRLMRGNIDDTLLNSIDDLPESDLVFMDGNHQLKPTLAYFKRLIKNKYSPGIVILDDIHWSSDMEKAWTLIKQMPEVSCSIDLYFMGIVFLNEGKKKLDVRLPF